MAGVELAQQRRDAFDAQRIRRGDAQPAARTALQLADRALGFVEFARDALAVFVVDVARLGEAELARGPVQQLRAQARFEFRSEERSVEKECVRPCRSRWSP